MSELLLGGMLPRRWRWDPIAAPFIQILLDWRDIEIDLRAETRLPILRQIHGHRRRDVMTWFDDTREVRDTAITQSIYGSPGACL